MTRTHVTGIKSNQGLAAQYRWGVVLLGVMVAGSTPAQGEGVVAEAELASPQAEALVMNEQTPVDYDGMRSTLRRLEVAEPGLLTLALVGEPGADSILLVTDDLGQQLYNGFLDWDANDAPGGEYGAVALTQPGVYFVAVRSWDGQASARLFASFTPLEGFVSQVDPQGRPDEALPIGVGLPVNQTLDTEAGDHRDWYRFESSRQGVVSFRTRVPHGSEADLGLDVFSDQDFSWAVAEGDYDLDEMMGNESVEIEVDEGEVVFVRVNAWGTDGASPYTLDARWQD